MNNEIIFLSIILCSILILTIIFFLIYKFCVMNHNQIVDDIQNKQDIIKFNPLEDKDDIPSAPPYDVYYLNQSDIINKNEYLSEDENYEENDDLDLGDYFLDNQNTYV